MKKFLIFSFVVILCALAMFLTVRMIFPIKHLDIITAHAGELEPSFILAVIMAESSFDYRAESRAGAQGLMQLMPATAADMARRMGMTHFTPEQVWVPEVNIAIGTFYLNWLKNYYDGNLDLVLAAYNAGLGNVNSWLNNPEFSTDQETIETIPFPETENYLRRVQQFQQIYRILLALP